MIMTEYTIHTELVIWGFGTRERIPSDKIHVMPIILGIMLTARVGLLIVLLWPSNYKCSVV